MADYLLLFIGTVLVNNFVLVKFLGLCPFMGVSKKLETAMGMGLATTFVMTLASICAWLIDTWILIPLNLVYLRTLAFILVIAVVVQFTEMVVRKNQPGAVPPAGYLPAADHHQLRRARRCAAEY
nr:electron transport complex protein RnfA [Raoultella sp. NCTC 9187]